MPLDGVYCRMEGHDRTRPFRNQARIYIAGASITYSSHQSARTELPTRWYDDTSFHVDWTPVCRRWGTVTFREHIENGVRGLEENAQHFWQYEHPAAPDMEDCPRSHRSRSPRFGPSHASASTDGLRENCDVPLLQTQHGNIEQVLYINLARRTDRQEEITRELQTLGIAEDSIIRIEAVDARDCQETPIVCCARSHIAALEHAMTEDLEAVLILEDDFMLCQSPQQTRERWARFRDMAPHFEIASWAHNCLRLRDRRDRGDARARYLQTASAYAVRRSAMKRLRDIYLDAIAQNLLFDRHMTTISNEVQWFALRPALSKQRPSYSDIEFQSVDYGC